MKNPINQATVSFPKKLNITDQEIDISSLSDAQKEYYVDLFEEVVRLYQAKKKVRVIVGLSGPAGAGKSVIAAIFHEIAKQRPLPFRFESIGIDAFHYQNDFLISNLSDGEPLKNHKGRFDTYDLPKLTEALTHFSLGHSISLPVYSRKIHDPIENVMDIKRGEPALLLVEGLWLLYDKNGWDKVGKLLDYSIFVEADNDAVRNNVLKRHVRRGRSIGNASEYYEENEGKNFDLVMKTKNKANKIIPSYYDLG
ncbi:MAG: hypothetical protein A2747_01010 [Candidatus Yonathbacteria bacterium RIFCSPHIGHO2_01_FULL_44_41]|uniref:Phosphoribulokinase/uridine kinase domain-containing protein n=1 Tax=Candidatus Yonathbacteria bacterium RIFCSPHIGHO2_02_FULL_44_14 TaxID=1802724 RepID=A0A1G2S6S7_9BACT|nr:MAG: hypothetical protein A2747_01010 [Candidatus Yonathbacteria bacterium RIFCSPHIGHO2_01_FULL_44_41]OHA80697.1 MAG: hypothetical protein A3D51_03990 [Candidatus Yonathbacteria bacterium RIFCSPHIGHO2_02_FULL_44_14]OHA81985.1 MAG: hypothetical protein A3B06_04015 [Candidatus Yonathbacteria bacterium RIFCSPLOWO2_01_FULL_43_20]